MKPRTLTTMLTIMLGISITAIAGGQPRAVGSLEQNALRAIVVREGEHNRNSQTGTAEQHAGSARGPATLVIKGVVRPRRKQNYTLRLRDGYLKIIPPEGSGDSGSQLRLSSNHNLLIRLTSNNGKATFDIYDESGSMINEGTARNEFDAGFADSDSHDLRMEVYTGGGASAYTIRFISREVRNAHAVSALGFEVETPAEGFACAPPGAGGQATAEAEPDLAHILSILKVRPDLSLRILPVTGTSKSSLRVSRDKAYKAYVLCVPRGSQDPDDCLERVYFTEQRTGTVYEILGEPEEAEVRPVDELKWANAHALSYERWTQPHFGHRYVVDVRRKRQIGAYTLSSF
jgi:hypothetical protein